MKNIIFTSTLILFALVIIPLSLHKNNTNTIYVPITSAADKIKMPIEVIGEEGKVVERTITIDNQTLTSTSKIWLMVNNLSYQNKGSIKINNRSWLSLNHQTADLENAEKQRGGMVHGGFNTIRFTIPATGLVQGTNTIKFRFNTSDGISIGYRVIRMNLVTGNGTKLLANSTFEEDNPNDWTSPLQDQTSINKGKDLWYNADLLTNYLPNGRNGAWYGKSLPSSRPMNAKCASCHTQDGRDLEMFSYSNESIIERSKFHNLTEQQGKQIASYIRSLSSTISKVGRYGRPWNPPYQPGPSLKNKPIEQWAAGAGIDAVLNEDKDMLPYLFPNGTSKTAVRNVFDSDKMEDRTTLPLAIQFPDWKHWLPIVHPMDAYNKNNWWNKLSDDDNPVTSYEWVRNEFEKNYNPNNIKAFNVPGKLRQLGKGKNGRSGFRHFHEMGTSETNHWRADNGDAIKNLSNGIPQELANTSLARLLAVKSFEIMNEFELQDKAPDVVPDPSKDHPADRQWPSNWYSVFEVPAHFTAKNSRNFETQEPRTGHYENTTWYNLQFVLNGGNGFVGGTTPTDFNYHNPFIGFAANSSGIDEPLRYFSAINHMYQIRTWSKSTKPGNDSFRIRFQGPWIMMGASDSNQEFWSPSYDIVKQLDNIKSGLSDTVLEAVLLQFLDEAEKYNTSTWPRVSPHGKNYELDPTSKRTRDLTTVPHTGKPTSGRLTEHYADKMYDIIPRIKNNFDVHCSIINRMADWSKSAWPNIDFEKFRINNCSNEVLTCNTPEIVPNGIYSIKTKHNKCINAVSNGGYNVTQQTCSDNDAGKWILEDAGTGYYYMKNLASGRYIQTTGTTNGNHVEEATFSGNDTQRWEIKTTNNCKFSIVSKSANKCLDLKSGNSADGTRFQVWNCVSNGSENREYSFELLDEVVENKISITKTSNATEGTSDAKFRVSLDNGKTNQTGTSITGRLTLTGTATKGTDYTNVSSFSIPNGQNSTVITIQITDDNEVENKETIIATISNPSTGNISNNNKATATIDDNDQSPVYSISITKTSDGTEGTSDAKFRVSLDNGKTNQTGTSITGRLTLTGTATKGTDYTNVSSFSISNGQNSTVITVRITDDNEIENKETIIATISNPNTGNISNNNRTTATINDNDVETCEITAIDANNVYRIKTKNDKCISATDSNEHTITQQVCNNTNDTKWVLEDAANGFYFIKNLQTNKYMHATGDTPGSLVEEYNFANNDNQRWKIVEIANCKFKIDSKISNLSLDLRRGENIDGNWLQLYEYKNDDASAINKTFSFEFITQISNSKISITKTTDAKEGISDASFRVSLDKGISNTAGSPITGTIILSGSATKGSDYTNVSSFSIPNGANSTLITIPVLDDNKIEDSETIIATISNPSTGSISTTNVATARIADQDRENVSLSIQTVRGALEGSSNAGFKIVLSDNLINSTKNGITGTISLSGNAEKGIDYTNVTSFSIPVGNNATEVTIPVLDDNLIEDIEFIIATIAQPSIGTIKTSTTSAIIEDDDKRNFNVSIETTSDAIEGSTNASFNIVLSNNLINSTKNNITGTISLSGTATSGLDYTQVTTFDILKGDNDATITIPVLDDNLVENTETIIATISTTNIGSISTNNSDTATINDDDTNNSCVTTEIKAGFIYKIKTKHNKCINAVSSNGYDITQQTCSDNDTGKWVLENADSGYYFIKNMGSNQYLQTTGNNNGNQVTESTFTGNDTQQWDIKTAQDCKFSIVSKSANKCLDLKSGYSADGTRFQIWSCDTNKSENREYTFESLGEDTSCNAAAINDNDSYRIKTKHNKSIEVAGTSSSNGNNVQQWESAEKDSQKWQLNDEGNGYYLIRNIRSNKCMDVSKNTANGVNIKEWRCHGKINQQWKITLLDNCTYQIRSRANDKCVDLKSGLDGNGANIQQWSCKTDNENQHFSFELLRDNKEFGIKDIVTSDIVVFPNPTNSILNVKIPRNDLDKSAEVRIYNFMGKLIKKETTKEDLISMSLENIPTGNYIVRVVSNKKTYDKIIVKE